MLYKIEFKLKENANWNENMGSILHGMLMEHISKDYANKMHEQGTRPYSTKLTRCNKIWKWTINTLNNEAYKEIIVKLKNKKSAYVKHLKTNIDLDDFNEDNIDINSKELTVDDIINKRVYEMEFVTPTSFKVSGEYVMFPSEKLIIQSLLSRFNIFQKRLDIDLEELVGKSKIIKYNLHSVNYHLEGIKIPAFKGKIVLSIKKADRNIDEIIKYGEYSGVGIKTALGMGGVITKVLL